jgi:hypothetical protein
LFSIGQLSNRLLVGGIVVEAFTLVAFVYVPPIQAALRQGPAQRDTVAPCARHAVE